MIHQFGNALWKADALTSDIKDATHPTVSHFGSPGLQRHAATMMSFEYQASLVLGNPVHQGLCERTEWYHSLHEHIWVCLFCLKIWYFMYFQFQWIIKFSLLKWLFVGIPYFQTNTLWSFIYGCVLLSHALMPHINKWIRTSQIMMAWNCTGLIELLRRFAMLTMAATSRSTHHTACGVHFLAVLDGSFGFGSGKRWNK